MSPKTVSRGKRYAAALEKREAGKRYDIDEAVGVLLDMPAVGFDETVEVAVRLGVDPRHADQIVRGTVVLPNGTDKKVHVTVIAQGEKLRDLAAELARGQARPKLLGPIAALELWCRA